MKKRRMSKLQHTILRRMNCFTKGAIRRISICNRSDYTYTPAGERKYRNDQSAISRAVRNLMLKGYIEGYGAFPNTTETIRKLSRRGTYWGKKVSVKYLVLTQAGRDYNKAVAKQAKRKTDRELRISARKGEISHYKGIKKRRYHRTTKERKKKEW